MARRKRRSFSDEIYAVPKTIHEQNDFDATESRGLFIGVGTFDDLPEIPYAVDDAVDLAYLFVFELNLLDAKGTVLCLSGTLKKAASAERLEKLLTGGATRHEAGLTTLHRQVWDVGQATGERGIFLLTVATHGFSDQGVDIFAAVDTIQRRAVLTGLSVSTLLDDVARAPAERRLLLLDTCRERIRSRTRGVSPEARGAMSPSFADAIDNVKGQVVLAATTLGGFSYDDDKEENGVFSGAVLHGLRGQAAADQDGFITVEHLAEFVDARVREWVKRERPGDVDVSRGISSTFEERAAKLPLAVHPRKRQAFTEYQQRRGAALGNLRKNVGGPITGAIYDRIASVLTEAPPAFEWTRVMEKLEALDGIVGSKRSLVQFFNDELDGRITVVETATPATVTASAMTRVGEDEFGRFMDLTVDRQMQRMRWIPPGNFLMGRPKPKEIWEFRQHEVTLTQGFWLAATPCTRGLWEAVTESNSSDFRDLNRPVEKVSWEDCQAFIKALNDRVEGPDFRLPTEAEWEYACRAGTTGSHYGDPDRIAWHLGNGGSVGFWMVGIFDSKTHAVAQKDPNAWGLYDMLGNVLEWCSDWDGEVGKWENLPKRLLTDTDPQGPRNGSERVLRGGSCQYHVSNIHAATRTSSRPGRRRKYTGFRLARGE